MRGAGSAGQRLEGLRRAFDEAFAAPVAPSVEERRSALAIRAGSGRFVVRLEDLAAVEACRRVEPLPEGAPGLLGLAGVRRRLVAAYDLAAILGCRPASAGGAESRPRWLLICASSPDVGLAIEAVEGYVRYSDADLRPGHGAGLGEHVREALLHDGALHGIVDVPSTVAALARRAPGAPPPPKESE